MSILLSIIVNFLFFLNKNTLRYTRYKNNLKIFYKDIFGAMAFAILYRYICCLT